MGMISFLRRNKEEAKKAEEATKIAKEPDIIVNAKISEPVEEKSTDNIVKATLEEKEKIENIEETEKEEEPKEEKSRRRRRN